MMNHVLRVTAQVIVMAIVLSVILLFVGIGVLIVIHICIVGRAFRRGFSNGGVVERGSFGSTSMSQDDIEKLPSFSYRDKERGNSPVGCAVCLENLKVGDKCRLLPQCNHSFHAECVDVWLLRTPLCPICRASADYRNSGLNFDEEIGRDSGSGVEYRDNQETASGQLIEAAVESPENQGTENSRLMNASIAVRVMPTSVESTHLDDSTISESQAAEDGHQDQIVIELTESRAEDHGHENEAMIAVRGSSPGSADQQTAVVCT